MPLQQFNNDDSLRAQRMTADEAKSVIDLWQQEREGQTGLTDKPAVPDVAEGLDIRVEDVQRLLAEVRARRVAEEAQLAQEQELSEIRLAEEERKLAEVRRQRAELRREQSEAERRRATQKTIPQESLPTWRQEVYLDRHSLYTKRETGGIGYKIGGIALGLVICWVIWAISQPPQHIYVSSWTTTYDANGQAHISDITCKNGSDDEVPCDDAAIAEEKASFQSSHLTVVTDTKKLTHDRQTHRGNH